MQPENLSQFIAKPLSQNTNDEPKNDNFIKHNNRNI
jgi:hypothetical protein